MKATSRKMLLLRSKQFSAPLLMIPIETNIALEIISELTSSRETIFACQFKLIDGQYFEVLSKVDFSVEDRDVVEEDEVEEVPAPPPAEQVSTVEQFSTPGSPPDDEILYPDEDITF